MAKKKADSGFGNEEKKALVEHENSALTIKRQCELIGLPRSTAYYRNIEITVSKSEIDVKNAIDKIHFKEPSYGVRRIRRELQKQGFEKVGKRLLRRYMEEMCVHVFYPGPNLSKRDKKAKTYPYLLRSLDINHPNHVWSIDITYIGTPDGFVYMALVSKAAYNIKVLNLSLGAPVAQSYTTDPLSQAAEAAWNAGIVVAAAAGNSGPAAGTINTPGINPHIITVGAADDRGTVDTKDDVIADFSSRGPTIDGLSKPDLLAPGVGMTSLASDTSYLPKKNSGLEGKPNATSQAESLGKPLETTISEYYVTMSGTSMATPMLSGAAALILEQNPSYEPDMTKKHLCNLGIDLGFDAYEQGFGEIQF